MPSGVFSCHHISQQLLLLYNKVQISSLLLSQLVCHSGKGNCPLRHKIIWKLLVSGKTTKRNFFRLKPFIKKGTICTHIFAPSPRLPTCKKSVCFYCHLTLFMCNKLIYRGFKSVRYVQSIIHYPAYILHAPPHCRAVSLDVCGAFYATGT